MLRTALAALALAAGASAQAPPTEVDPADVASLDAIIEAYYQVVSGPAGAPRDWGRDSTLHHPDAIVTVVRTADDGAAIVEPFDLAAFHRMSAGVIATGFFEREVARETQRHGSVAHVWSTYEWRTTETGPVGGRGVNSIQLVWDGSRWWIVSWMFDGRTDVPPVPAEYLPR